MTRRNLPVTLVVSLTLYPVSSGFRLANCFPSLMPLRKYFDSVHDVDLSELAMCNVTDMINNNMKKDYLNYSRDTEGVELQADGSYIAKCWNKLVQDIFDKGSSHVRAVLSWAVVSPARYAVMQKLPVPSTCPFCQQTVAPTWDHQVWECSFFHETRPSTKPSCPLTQVVGWPSVDEDHTTLEHMARIRAATLSDRYRCE